MLINFNGKLLEESDAQLGINRAMRYGDGVFETIRLIDGKLQWWSAHFDRMKKGLDYLEIAYPENLGELLDVECQKLISKMDLRAGGKVRIQVYRSGRGTYLPETNELDFVIEAIALESNGYSFKKTGYRVDLSKTVRLNSLSTLPLKSLNAIPYIKASIEKDARKLDEVILLNEHGFIAEATASNLFLFIDGIWYTPRLDQACLPGIFRSKLIQYFKQTQLCIESAIEVEQLRNADEIILCNSILGIQWVSAFENRRYFHREIDKIRTNFSCNLLN